MSSDFIHNASADDSPDTKTQNLKNISTENSTKTTPSSSTVFESPASSTSSSTTALVQQNNHLLKMLEGERQEKKRMAEKMYDFRSTIEDQNSMIERLRLNRRRDPALRDDSGAIARSNSDASYAQARLREADALISLKNAQIVKLQRELQRERQRAEIAEKEALRIEQESRKARSRYDSAKHKELYTKIREHFIDNRQSMDEAKIKHLEAKIVELELENLNPGKSEMTTTMRRLERKLEEEEMKRESLQECVVDAHDALSACHAQLENSHRETAEAVSRAADAESERRLLRRRAEDSTAETAALRREFELYKASVGQSLGDLADNLDVGEEELEGIDADVLKDFLREF